MRLVTLENGNKPTLILDQIKAAIELVSLEKSSSGQTKVNNKTPLNATVKIWPTVVKSYGGYDQVQPLFGGNVNGNSVGKADDLLGELKMNTSRLHMWPDTYGAPKEMRSPSSKSSVGQFGTNNGYFTPLPEDKIGPAWDKWFKQDFKKFLDPSISTGAAGQSVGSQQNQLAMQKKWGTTDNIVFFASNKFDSNAIRNSEGVCRYFEQYLDTVKKYAPWIKATFLQPTNEPNYGWWVGSFQKDKGDPVAGWVEFYNNLNKHLSKTHPETKLLGPCLASSEFFSWSGWNKWTVPVLKGVENDMEYYNYHNYDTPANSHLAWVEMLQAKAESLGKKRPRAIVTEMNDGTDTGVAARKLEWYAEQLFTALENPDKFHLLSYFMTVSLRGTRDGGWGNLIAMENKKCVPTEIYWLFWELCGLSV